MARLFVLNGDINNTEEDSLYAKIKDEGNTIILKQYDGVTGNTQTIYTNKEELEKLLKYANT